MSGRAVPKDKRGRPPLTDEDAAKRAAHIIDVAVMVRNGQFAQLARLGYSRAQALQLVNKRHRGRVGKFIGDSLRELAPGANVARAMARQVLMHERDSAEAGAPIDRVQARAEVGALHRGQRPSRRDPGKAVADKEPPVSHSELTRALLAVQREQVAERERLEAAGYRFLGATDVDAPAE